MQLPIGDTSSIGRWLSWNSPAGVLRAAPLCVVALCRALFVIHYLGECYGNCIDVRIRKLVIH